MALERCEISCRAMGSARYRWFMDGCCQCVGHNCSQNGMTRFGYRSLLTFVHRYRKSNTQTLQGTSKTRYLGKFKKCFMQEISKYVACQCLGGARNLSKENPWLVQVSHLRHFTKCQIDNGCVLVEISKQDVGKRIFDSEHFKAVAVFMPLDLICSLQVMNIS